MKQIEVPQDHAKAFMGHSKILYAQNARGELAAAPSDGWEAEEIVLDQALAECQRLARDAHARAREGRASPLEVHMYVERMDLPLLAQATGYAKWRVRRHLKPGAFAKLPASIRARYAEALGKPAEALDTLPDAP